MPTFTSLLPTVTPAIRQKSQVQYKSEDRFGPLLTLSNLAQVFEEEILSLFTSDS